MGLSVRSLLLFFLMQSLLSIYLASEMDEVRYEAGKKQFELIQGYSDMPKYGKCWRNAMTVIQNGCKRLTDTTQSRLALAYLNCFLEIQGHEGYDCSEDQSLEDCTKDMKDGDRSSFSTFFTHTQSICYFLQAQVWQEQTDNTIKRLSSNSKEVADLLESSHQLQQDLVDRQSQSLTNQQTLMEQAQNLSKVIDNSSHSVRHLFEDLKKSTQEQSQIIGEVFDQLGQLKSTVLGEVTGFYSLFYYCVSIIICYLLTSTPRTAGARLWLFLIMTCNIVLEQTLMRWIFVSSNVSENEYLYWVQRYCRRFTILLALALLCLCAFMYQDINAVNNQLLVEIRKQNSDIRKIMMGTHSKEAISSTQGTGQEAINRNDDTDSDYTSDEDSDADSDRTYILPENREDVSDTESFMTVTTRDGEDRHESLMRELSYLRDSTPMRSMSTTVQSWLGAQELDEDRQLFPQGMNMSQSSPHSYNLRPRKSPGRCADASPVDKVESPKSFSRTVKQLQQISEKNSRLVRAHLLPKQ